MTMKRYLINMDGSPANLKKAPDYVSELLGTQHDNSVPYSKEVAAHLWFRREIVRLMEYSAYLKKWEDNLMARENAHVHQPQYEPQRGRGRGRGGRGRKRQHSAQ